MHKNLKFVPNLVDLILTGKKTSTWRLWDDKNLQVGDIVDFLEFGSLKHFATAKIDKVIERKLGELTLEEMSGHEVYQDKEEMYKKFSEYYQKPVDSGSLVKVIWFTLI